MIEFLQSASLLTAMLTSGLLAGLFYAYSISVMPGLGRADDTSFIVSFQGINEAIINGWFMASFIGGPLLTIVAIGSHIPGEHRDLLPWLVAAAAAHVSTFVITGRVNVPLNNALAAAGEDSTPHSQARERFETRWNRWNNVRTLTSLAAFFCLAVALFVR
ncbi:DUF1772 domain-containing protein [Natronoglycomyces albus]|uniref:DUF1772 domain-containing protein n=1 Tax=Natronoglycomyces albus TaxID=2811108 RepID=A0A895XF52_9ACTN|nr:anthrone oxygenase family protein [Natronoglycomyces albus]QSB03954.1 DUF1772 domain-containing protein [Natronoglycomyces albus]